MTKISFITLGIMIIIIILDLVPKVSNIIDRCQRKQKDIENGQNDSFTEENSDTVITNYSKPNFDFPNIQSERESRISNTGVNLDTIENEIEIKTF